MKFSGEIDVTGNDRYWVYDVHPQCVISDDKVSFDFSGIKDGWKFHGHCSAEKIQLKKYFGSVEFQYDNYDAYQNPIELTVELKGEVLDICGTWLEDGVKYEMDGELKKIT